MSKPQRESFADGILKPTTRPTPEPGDVPDTWDEDVSDDKITKLLTNVSSNNITNNHDDNIVNNSTHPTTYTADDIQRWKREAKHLSDPDEYEIDQMGARVAVPFIQWLDSLVSQNNLTSRRARKISRQDIVVYALRLAYVEIMKNGGVFKKNMSDDPD